MICKIAKIAQLFVINEKLFSKKCSILIGKEEWGIWHVEITEID